LSLDCRIHKEKKEKKVVEVVQVETVLKFQLVCPTPNIDGENEKKHKTKGSFTFYAPTISLHNFSNF